MKAENKECIIIDLNHAPENKCFSPMIERLLYMIPQLGYQYNFYRS